MRKHPAAHTRVDNFWSKLRVDKNITVREIAEMLGMKEKAISAYFTGFIMPDEDTVRELCELFEVDFNTGYLEFQHAHKNYTPSKRTSTSYTHTPSLDTTTDEHYLGTTLGLLERLYTVVPFKDFITLFTLFSSVPDGKVNVAELAYKQVSFDTYMLLLRIVKEDKERLMSSEENITSNNETEVNE